jgi:hypothetical protein
MDHFGFGLSEPMCLGLGLGPNFFYMRSHETRPSRFFLGRNPTLEEDFFRLLEIGAPVRKAMTSTPEFGPIRRLLDAGHPVMIQVDICHLPYYNTDTHFGGHKVLAAGYDAEEGFAVISDSEFPEPQRVALPQLVKARWDPAPPWGLEGQWWDLSAVRDPTPLAEAVPQAITECALRNARDHTGLFGIEPMRRAVKDLPSWSDAPDWKWAARFGYQVIERRGTGGGSFRTKYADFLEESRAYDPRIGARGLAEKMRAVASLWTRFALLLKTISEQDAPDGFDGAAAVFAEIAAGEEEFFEAVLRDA